MGDEKLLSAIQWLNKQRKKGIITGWTKVDEITYRINFNVRVPDEPKEE